MVFTPTNRLASSTAEALMTRARCVVNGHGGFSTTALARRCVQEAYMRMSSGVAKRNLSVLPSDWMEALSEGVPNGNGVVEMEEAILAGGSELRESAAEPSDMNGLVAVPSTLPVFMMNFPTLVLTEEFDLDRKSLILLNRALKENNIQSMLKLECFLSEYARENGALLTRISTDSHVIDMIKIMMRPEDTCKSEDADKLSFRCCKVLCNAHSSIAGILHHENVLVALFEELIRSRQVSPKSGFYLKNLMLKMIGNMALALFQFCTENVKLVLGGILNHIDVCEVAETHMMVIQCFAEEPQLKEVKDTYISTLLNEEVVKRIINAVVSHIESTPDNDLANDDFFFQNAYDLLYVLVYAEDEWSLEAQAQLVDSDSVSKLAEACSKSSVAAQLCADMLLLMFKFMTYSLPEVSKFFKGMLMGVAAVALRRTYLGVDGLKALMMLESYMCLIEPGVDNEGGEFLCNPKAKKHKRNKSIPLVGALFNRGSSNDAAPVRDAVSRDFVDELIHSDLAKELMVLLKEPCATDIARSLILKFAIRCLKSEDEIIISMLLESTSLITDIIEALQGQWPGECPCHAHYVVLGNEISQELERPGFVRNVISRRDEQSLSFWKKLVRPGGALYAVNNPSTRVGTRNMPGTPTTFK